MQRAAGITSTQAAASSSAPPVCPAPAPQPGPSRSSAHRCSAARDGNKGEQASQ